MEVNSIQIDTVLVFMTRQKEMSERPAQVHLQITERVEQKQVSLYSLNQINKKQETGLVSR